MYICIYIIYVQLYIFVSCYHAQSMGEILEIQHLLNCSRIACPSVQHDIAFPFRFLFGTSFNMRFTATRSLSTENLRVSVGDAMPRQDIKDCHGLPLLFDGLSLGNAK